MKTRSARRRWHEARDVPAERPASRWRSKRVVALLAALVALAGLLTVTQISSAHTRRRTPTAACTAAPPTGKAPAPSSSATGKASPSASKSNPAGADPAAGDVPNPGQTAGNLWGGNQNGRNVQNHVGDGQESGASNWRRPGQCTPSSSAPTTAAPTSTASSAPLEILGNNCDKSRLQAHDGFQNGSRCVSTAFGEVGDQSKNPTLLIVRAPLRVRVGEAFTIQVATRNLVRDRFLAAGKGGYYLESSFLTADGLVRGHFHNACRMLASTRSAPDPAPVPAFFVATEDGGGDANSSTLTINVAGMPSPGVAQCASWAGDGSHRIPMMARANQIPAFDSVRIIVTP
jgi:hypothetical protein